MQTWSYENVGKKKPHWKIYKYSWPGSHSKQVKHWSDFILKTGIIWDMLQSLDLFMKLFLQFLSYWEDENFFSSD